MSEWRPEGWENPYFTQERYDECEGAYDAGADAMLAALKEQSVHVDVGVDKGIVNLPFHGGSHGFVVFIPDKE